MKLYPDEEEAYRMLRLLGNPVCELRAIALDGSVKRAWFTDMEALAGTACGMSHVSSGEVYGGLYVTVNELDHNFSGLAGTEMVRGPSTGKRNVSHYRHLGLDIDWNKPEGFKGPATEAEHQAVLEIADRARQLILAMGWPEPMLVDSGNGAYVFCRVDLPNTVEMEQLVSRTLVEFGRRLDNEFGHVDRGVGDPSRIFRLAGTINRKGTETAQRPYRLARIVSAPDQLETVTIEQLVAFAGYAPPQDAPQDFGEQPADPKRVAAVVRYLEQAGVRGVEIRERPGCTCINLPRCIFKGPDNLTGAPGIVVSSNGFSYSCFHEGCQAKTWADVERALKLKFHDVAKELASDQLFGDSRRIHSDPLLLAEKHLSKWASKDGTQTMACFGGETYRYDRDGWEVVKAGELDPWIRETAQQVFDQHAKVVSELEGKEIKPEPIRGQLVHDTYRAMQSLCKHAVPRTAQAPFWLVAHEWDADDLLIFANGVLNVRRLVEGKPDCFIPPTAKLFYRHQAAFDYSVDAPKPAAWFAFLDSLEQDATWRTCLQQMMGYCLWAGYDLQKFLQFCGPKRCGKGTIARVLTDLLGGPKAVCAPDLEDFADSFGLEDAIDKRLAVVPEASVPSKGVRKIVARMKAITGGDMVMVNRKGIRKLSLHLKLKILLISNEFIVFPDNSGAMHARTFPLRFTKTFLGKEDLTLADKLKAEYPAILNWALEGVRSLWEDGGKFTLPESSQEELDQLSLEAAPLQAFVEECCDLDLGFGCHSAALYGLYRDWHLSQESGDDLLSDSQFAIELRKTVHSISKVRLGKPGERTFKRCRIVATRFDSSSKKRPPVWLGIAPKPEYLESTN